jgi:uncharacterized protein
MKIYIIPAGDDKPQDKFIIYRPLIGLAFVGNRAMAGLTLAYAQSGGSQPQASEKAVEFLRSVGFFEPDPPEPTLPEADFMPTMAVLLLTNQCQLRCQYCYAAAGEPSPRQLTIETARAAIDHVHQIATARGKPHFEVSFHGGGEPTLAWKIIQEATAYARQKPLPAKITLTSNGIWPKAQGEWIFKNIDGLTLSLDGRPETQDRRRPFASGRGSSDQVMRSVAELDSRSFPYGIRMTAMAPWSELPQDVRFLCENTGCKSIQVEPTFNTSRGGHGEASDEEILAFGDAYLEAWEIAGQAGRRFYYSGARAGIRTATFCSAPFQALITDVSGALVTCYEVTGPSHPLYEISKIGQVDESSQQVNLDNAARSRLLDMIRERREACRDCFCYYTCAGDCYARAFVEGPDGHLVRGSRCVLNRHLTRRLLLYMIAQNGGVWRGFNRYDTPLPDAKQNEVGSYAG